MIHQVHEHLLSELKSNAQTDKVFVLTAILLNLVTLAINSGVAAGSGNNMLIMMVFIGLIVVVNVTVEIGLIKGKQMRTKLLGGLIKMYQDNDVDQYYDKSMLGSYETRYNLFMLTVLVTGLVAVLVPFLVM